MYDYEDEEINLDYFGGVDALDYLDDLILDFEDEEGADHDDEE
tara:strand:+ start:666 stop:794 length:129 start_codon:yes stop_codon:yes gene_type:complete